MAINQLKQLTVEPGENRGKSFQEGGIGVLFKIFGGETGGALAVVEHPVDPHRLVPPHTHSDVDEYSYVIEGEIGARIGDRVVSAGPGTYVLKPRGVMHTFWNATDKPARILEILSPGKFEKFFDVTRVFHPFISTCVRSICCGSVIFRSCIIVSFTMAM